MLGSPAALESVMRPIDNNFYSGLIRPRTFLRPLAMFVAVAVGGIGGATVILSLASPPGAERSSRVMMPETAAVSPGPEIKPHLASATPTTSMMRTESNIAAPVDIPRKFNVPTKREAQNRRGRVAYRGKYHYRNFARYFAPRFSASW
jgi:hypothetical protein